MSNFFKLFKLNTRKYSQGLFKNSKPLNKFEPKFSVKNNFNQVYQPNKIFYLTSKKLSSTFSMKDAVTVDQIRTKMVKEPIYAIKTTIKRSVINSHLKQIEQFKKIEDKEEILNYVVPELFSILYSLKLCTSLKTPEILDYCVHVFNQLSGKDFPIILVPYFLNTQDKHKRMKISSSILNSNFLSNCEKGFKEKSAIFYLDELSMFSFIVFDFTISKKFLFTLENCILHKLEFEGITFDLPYTFIRLFLTAKYFSNEYRFKLLEKVSFFINQNCIDNTSLIEMVYIIGSSIRGVSRDQLLIAPIENFLFSIREKILAIPLDSPKLICALIKIVSFRRFSYMFSTSGDGDFIKVLLDNFVSKIGSFKIRWIADVFKYSLNFSNLDQITINKLSTSALGLIHKINEWKVLQNFAMFVNRFHPNFIHLIEIQAIQLMIDNVPRDKFFDSLMFRLNKKGILFEQVYLKYVNTNVKSTSATKEDSESDDNKEI
jgi:hypothetical protein